MNRRSSSIAKPRPVARADWEDQADEELKALWSTSSVKPPNPQYTQTASTRVHRRRSESEATVIMLPQSKTTDPNHKHNEQRALSLPAKPKAQPTKTTFNADISLTYARRRIRTVKDFDKMLKQGFPALSHRQSDPELTLYISLTPSLASQHYSLPSYKPK
ncbi:hypothetical protein DSO57_1024101 [Entomophthora muscae]|uniref:Uncharacterized protein n=1 Tax=Entomophthora muscae TaxID=34485 RepID=A0ACC2SFM0_9FUNG|nr:hypothetical protein DSO57_1024101 [Entomophthora muscae]